MQMQENGLTEGSLEKSRKQCWKYLRGKTFGQKDHDFTQKKGTF